jgi:hypothetical protein
MVNVLESTLASTKGVVIVNYGIGSHTAMFSLDSASVLREIEMLHGLYCISIFRAFHSFTAATSTLMATTSKFTASISTLTASSITYFEGLFWQYQGPTRLSRPQQAFSQP